MLKILVALSFHQAKTFSLMTELQATKRRHPALIYVPAMLVSLIGLADSVYLTVQHLTGKSVKCTVTNG